MDTCCILIWKALRIFSSIHEHGFIPDGRGRYSSTSVMSLSCWKCSFLHISPYYQGCSPHPLYRIPPFVTTSANEDDGIYARESLKWATFIPFLNAPTKIPWFEWMKLIKASLKQTRYSLWDSEGPYQMLNKLVVDIFLCWMDVNWCISFFTSSL